MDVQATPVAGQTGTSGVLQPLARGTRRGPNEDLRQARASMGSRDLANNPLSIDLDQVASILSSEDEPVIRRRASSTGESGVTLVDGWREMAFVRQLSKDIRRETDSGKNKGDREMRKRDFPRHLIDALITRHHGYLRILHALSGGCARATDAQTAQAFALCVLDVNRQLYMDELIAMPDVDKVSSAKPLPYSNEPLRLLVVGAKRLTEFDELPSMLALWSRVRLEAHDAGREVMRLALINTVGLFETNARRFLNAYEEAASTGGSTDIKSRMRSGLVKQWMCGVSDIERTALHGASGEQCAEFHRKLTQQYALLCRHFGQPLPPLAELILVDHDDRD